MHSFVQQNLKMQGSSEMMTWTVQCLKEDKKVALTKTVPAAGILALPLNLELWLLPSSGEAAPAAPTRHWNEPTRSSVVVSVGLHFWDQSGPLSDQGHKYTEAQNIGIRVELLDPVTEQFDEFIRQFICHVQTEAVDALA